MSQKMRRRMSRFASDEDGSYSIEAVIWMPIFAILLAVVMNVSLVFFNQSQMMRVVQDANRMFSLGRFDDVSEVDTYVLTNLSYLTDNLTVNSTVNNGLITTQTSAPATDLMPMNFLRGTFTGTQISVTATHIIEY